MRDTVNRKEQMLSENLRYQRMGRSRGHIAENGGLAKRDGDNKSEGLDSMVWTEGQAAWRNGKVEKSKPGVENSRLTVERMG